MKVFIMLLLLTISLFAMSREQISVLQTAYSMGKMIKAKNGTSFENTLAAIALTESSAGVDIVGDDRTKTGEKKLLVDSSLGCMQIRISTAKELAKKYKIISWLSNYSDEELGFKLMSSNQLSAMIAGLHIAHYYDVALSRKWKRPWFKTISRYNGGWNNTYYFNKVKKNMKIIKRLVKNGAIR